MRSFALKLSLVCLVLFTVAGCSSDDSSSPTGGGNNTTVLVFLGTVNGTNGSLSGSVLFSINGTAVTGTFKITSPAASTHTLTGTYNASTKAITATGDGYNFAGTYDGANTLDGTLTGTGTGTFVSVKDDNSTAVAFCGTFTGDDDGVWNFTVDGGIISGSYTTTSGTTGALSGTISGTTITIGTLATGTRSGDNASGTWTAGANSGTWTGSKCN